MDNRVINLIDNNFAVRAIKQFSELAWQTAQLIYSYINKRAERKMRVFVCISVLFWKERNWTKHEKKTVIAFDEQNWFMCVRKSKKLDK